MAERRELLRSTARATVALWAALALLCSTLLASGAHEHSAWENPEVVCSIDHQGQPDSGAGAHGAERPHRHHCASCQLAAKSAARKPGPTAILERPGAAQALTAAAVAAESGLRRSSGSPRGPPLS